MEMDRPSLQWVCCLFHVVNELQTDVDGKLKKLVVNVDEVLKLVIKHFGSRAQATYFSSG